MNRPHGVNRTVILLPVILMLLVLPTIMVLADPTDRETKTYEDNDEDVLVDAKKGPLDRLMDLKNLDGDKADEFDERIKVDIRSLTIVKDSTYISFILMVEGRIQIDGNFSYYICGYTRDDPEESETFDFIISYSGGRSSYEVWEEGKYVIGSNVSQIRIEGATLNLSMNWANFIISSRDSPYLICGFIVMYPGEGQDRYIDYVTSKDTDEGPAISNDTWMFIQVGFIGFLIITMFILWNFWAKKRNDVEQEGGVCPKCESRLDKNLDFCPHCGSFIRGPQADKENPKPRIVSPLDIEMEE